MEQDTKRKISKKPIHPQEDAKIDRIAGHTLGLVEDLKAWFELKTQFVKLDIKEQVEAELKNIALDGVAFVILGIAAVFVLIALALGLGTWLSHPAWGFLVVAGLLVGVAVLIKYLVDRRKRKEEIETDTLTFSVPEPNNKLPELPAEQHGKD